MLLCQGDYFSSSHLTNPKPNEMLPWQKVENEGGPTNPNREHEHFVDENVTKI